MKRTFATTTFAVALLGVAACKGGGAASAKLIPEGATMVGGVDLAAVQKSSSWEDNKAMLESQGKEALDAMGKCNLGLDKFKNITVGMDPAGGDEKLAVVIVADGIGKKENLDCAKGEIKKQEGGDEEPWTEEEEGKVLKLDGGKATAFVVDDNTIAIAGKAWAEDVKKLVGGEGKSAFDGGLKDVIARTDTSKNIWFAGKLPDEAKGMAKMAGDIGEPTDVAGWADVSSGLEVFVAVGFGSGDDATKAKEAVEKQWEGVKGMASGAGVPQGVVDSVKFGADGSAATITAKASAEDMKTIEAEVKKNMGM